MFVHGVFHRGSSFLTGNVLRCSIYETKYVDLVGIICGGLIFLLDKLLPY